MNDPAGGNFGSSGEAPRKDSFSAAIPHARAGGNAARGYHLGATAVHLDLPPDNTIKMSPLASARPLLMTPEETVISVVMIFAFGRNLGRTAGGRDQASDLVV
jgi:hypothetical protein